MNSYAIVGDIHGNLTSLLSVLDSIDKYREKEPIKNVIFMGDLLSYGVETNECIYKLFKYSQQHKCIFLLGNHDLIYLQENPLSSPYLNSKATWLKDSIINTFRDLDKNLLSKINFKNYLSWNQLYFHMQIHMY